MKKIFILNIIAIFLFISCNEELITIVDEYNSPYGICAIPGNGKVSISFWSGVIASDFAGFNIYAGNSSTFTQPDDAIKNSLGAYPTVAGSNHTRTNFVIEIPNYAFNNGTLYYVAVTAYGTNNLVDTKYIETKITLSMPVMPRPEGTGTGTTLTADTATVGTMDPNTGKVIASGGWKVQYFGYQTNFNAVVVVTNNTDNSFDSESVYSVNGLYIFKNVNQLAKIWIQSANSYKWAYQSDASQWWGI
ncbi:hypothetical protein BRSU_1169 [Brachyspira suanatina]|uniref:Uncharacterized protein n=1 Tax=Brachyspira suanatina TaxID=381802 RepID=A0A0G4K6J0_9SPIR|nr:hypothetical protein [Brachyspira suanatina]CRF33017.1 hypothetical protein BRSU_1169 [Brachyspira suanatina]